MSKKDEQGFTTDMLMADALLKIKTLQKLLIDKNIITSKEFEDEMNAIAAQIAKDILQKSKIPGDIEEIVKSLNKKNSDN